MKTSFLPTWLVYILFLITAFLFVFFFSCTTSPLYEHHPFWFHGDSGIFQEMGVCLLQGGTPYVDLFDHKGPILWFIQALGIWISPRWGLMALQSILLFCTMIIWYKSSRLLVDKQIESIAIIISSLIFLLAFYQRGNLCEEWSLLFISIPIFLYLKRWEFSHDTEPYTYNHTDAFIIGLCVGIIAMIRLNNTAPIVGFVLWHFIRCIQLKDYKRLWADIALICDGMAIVILACVLFYYIKGGWTGVYEMLYGTFIFNFIYIDKGRGDLSLLTKIEHYTPSFLSLIVTISCFIHDKSSKHLFIPIIISYIICFLAIGGMGFVHYMTIFIPLFVLSISLVFHTSINWTYIIVGLAIVFSLYLGYDAVDHLIFRLKGKKADTELNDGFHRFISSIPAEEQRSIYNAGISHMGAGLFADENIYQCNRIIYMGHLDISSHLRKYIETHGIKDLQPIWVLTQSPRPEIKDEYLRTNYTLSDSIPGGQFDPIFCWKKYVTP